MLVSRKYYLSNTIRIEDLCQFLCCFQYNGSFKIMIIFFFKDCQILLDRIADELTGLAIINSKSSNADNLFNIPNLHHGYDNLESVFSQESLRTLQNDLAQVESYIEYFKNHKKNKPEEDSKQVFLIFSSPELKGAFLITFCQSLYLSVLSFCLFTFLFLHFRPYLTEPILTKIGTTYI